MRERPEPGEIRGAERDQSSRLAGLSQSERFAAIAVERATGAIAIAHDVDGRQGAYDIALIYSDGRTAAVEVTSHAGGGQRQLEGLLARENFQWPNPGEWAWFIQVSDPAEIPFLREVYAYVIALCEQHGAARPSVLAWPLRTDPALRWLQDSTVSMNGHPDVPAVEGDRLRPVYIMPRGDGGTIDHDLLGLDEAVTELLSVPTVAKRVAKVSTAETDERHLFVSVDSSGLPFPVSSALMGRPERLPTTSTLTAPPPLSHLWLAPRFTHVLLGWTVTGGWQAYDVYG